MWSFYVPFNSHPYLRLFHHARGGTLRSSSLSLSPFLSVFLSVSLSPFPPLFPLFILYLDPLSWILPTGLYLSSLLNEEMTELICDFNTCLPDDTLSAPCRGPKRSFSSHPPLFFFPKFTTRLLFYLSFPFWMDVGFIYYLFCYKVRRGLKSARSRVFGGKNFPFLSIFHFQDSVIQN